VTARTLRGDGLLLTDMGAVISNEAGCRTLSPHSVMCSIPAGETLSPEEQSAPPVHTSLVIRGGDGGDVIDARGFTEPTELTGGRGSDKIYCPLNGGCILRGGGGHNLLVGNRQAIVSFTGLRGPVTVDLRAGFGIAPRERDRIVGLRNVSGGNGVNRLFGGSHGGELNGGSGTNLLVSRSAGTSLSLPYPHRPSTVVCTRNTDVYSGLTLDDADEVVGPCFVRPVQLLPFATLTSPVLSVLRVPRATEVTIRVAATSQIIGHALVPAGEGVVYCSLATSGRRLLQQVGSLRVHVEVPQPAGYFGARFSTVLSRPRLLSTSPTSGSRKSARAGAPTTQIAAR